jgi:hypothetical protein
MDTCAAERYNPFEARPRFHDPFEVESKARAHRQGNRKKRAIRDPFEARRAAPIETAYEPRPMNVGLRSANFQVLPTDPAAQAEMLNSIPAEGASKLTEPSAETQQSTTATGPCSAAAERPLCELGIGIEPLAGQLPPNRAATCWESINAKLGPTAGARFWAGFNYYWDATCLCHRPLYFEEINLERYGYGCGWCLQPAASAAHFFGTVPALPYLATVDCPHECIYTLGHYRPGSCPPWHCHWPPCDPLAAVAEGGVMTGLIFLVP